MLGVAVALVALAGAVRGDDVVGCGGFIEGGSEGFDYGAVRVLLVSPDGGLVKYSADVAPGNGYYFIPMYDRGQFVLRVVGPDGWTFEPTEVPVTISDSDNTCASDINFRLTGFGLSGKLEASPQCGAVPSLAGATVSLSPGSASVTTQADGSFVFSNVSPGAYSLSVARADATVAPAAQEVTVGVGQVDLSTTPFLLTGFAVTGSVSSSSSSDPAAGVSVVLHSDSVSADAVACTRPSGSGSSATALCEVTTAADGSFRFDGLPCGAYHAVPVFRDASTDFEFEPARVDVTVSGAPLALATPTFSVLGFTVSGKVVDPLGAGVAGAQVLVDGEQRAVADAAGQYRLERLATGTYTITAAKEQTRFGTLAGHRVSPSAVVLPDIVASEYAVCGRILLETLPQGALKGLPEVRLQETGSAKSVMVPVGEDGTFCTYAAPGQYVVSPVLAQSDLVLSPLQRNIEVAGAPIANLDFLQARVSVSGSVKCLGSACDDAITVSLIPSSRGGSSAAPTSQLDSKNRFQFGDVLPGDYQLVIQQDTLCWQQSAIDLRVHASDIADLEFVQTGFQLSLQSGVGGESSVAVSVTGPLGSESTSTVEVAFAKSHAVCVGLAGKYSVQPQQKCFQYSSSTFEHETGSGRELDLTPTHRFAVGRVSGQLPADAETVPVSFSVAGEPADAAIVLLAARVAGTSEFEYRYWATIGKAVTVEPRVDGVQFFPPSTVIEAGLAAPECTIDVPRFEARSGTHLSGQVTPAVANVEIRFALQGDAAEHAAFRAEVPAELTALTDEQGRYTAGPIYEPSARFAVTAHKDGYEFEAVEGGFKSAKLAGISVEVVDTDGQPLPGVLLSLSAPKYRNNTATGERGTMFFGGLNTGEYHLRALLKEFQFEPASQTVALGDGDVREIKIVGTRFAFSCFGTVTSLRGDPEKDVTVRAVGAEQYEEAQTDAEGRFRLRGLTPNMTYDVVVQTDSASLVARAAPAKTAITVTQGDVTGLHFVAFRRQQTMSLSGIVRTETPEHLETLTVELSMGGSAHRAYKTAKLGLVPYFQFGSVAKDEYVVRLRSSLSTRDYELSLPEVSVAVGDHPATVELAFSATPRRDRTETTQSQFFTLVAGVAILLAVIYHEKTAAVFAQIADRVREAKGSSGSADAAASAGPAASKSKSKKSSSGKNKKK